MRVGPLPSNPGNPGGGGVPPEALLPIATGLYSGAQAYNQISTTHNDSLNRSLQRDKSLSSGTITPRQYVFQCVVLPKKIKRGLLAWGGKHEGFDYSHPKHFDVQGKLFPSDNPLKMALGIKVQSCSLRLYKAGQTTELMSKSSSLNVPVDLDPAAKETPSSISLMMGPDGGLRGGYTPPPELEEVTEDVEHLTTSSYTNLSCDISEDYIEGLSSRQVADVFTCENTQLISPIWVYAISIGLAFGLSLFFNKFTKKSSKQKSSKDSQEPVSMLKEDRSVEACDRPLASYIVKQCEGQGLDGPPTRGTPEFLLKIFESYKRGTITKKGTTRVLMIYYNLSKEEALEWLEEE